MADLNTSQAKVAERIRSITGFPGAGADTVVSNLAIHYMLGSTEHMNNFVALCLNLVRVGGDVVLTTMFGLEVFRKLQKAGVKPGETWDSFQDEALKFSIRRQYAEGELTSAGQKIGVLLPFSDGNYYEEFLVNVRVLTDAFIKRGFRLLATPLFSEYFKEFQTRNSTVDKMLTAGDREWLSLYGVIHLRREK